MAIHRMIDGSKTAEIDEMMKVGYEANIKNHDWMMKDLKKATRQMNQSDTGKFYRVCIKKFLSNIK